jgi:hypothetical protein
LLDKILEGRDSSKDRQRKIRDGDHEREIAIAESGLSARLLAMKTQAPPSLPVYGSDEINLPDVSYQDDLECSSEEVVEIDALTSSAKRTAQQAEIHLRDPEPALLELQHR